MPVHVGFSDYSLSLPPSLVIDGVLELLDCSSSLSSSLVQGDVADEVLEMIENGVGVLKGIPADNVEIVEEKRKKGD